MGKSNGGLLILSVLLGCSRPDAPANDATSSRASAEYLALSTPKPATPPAPSTPQEPPPESTDDEISTENGPPLCPRAPEKGEVPAVIFERAKRAFERCMQIKGAKAIGPIGID
jgi:hypothetical protein